jgi:hypothetical protein
MTQLQTDAYAGSFKLDGRKLLATKIYRKMAQVQAEEEIK